MKRRLAALGAALVFALSLSACNDSSLPDPCTQALRLGEEVLQSGEKMATYHSSADYQHYADAASDLAGRGQLLRERTAQCKTLTG